MNPTLELSVIICTYNRCELLGEALESLVKQDIGRENYEVIVVDNNSTDDTRSVVESFIGAGHAHIRYLFEGKQGLSHARNAGIAAARAPIVTFTDDDIRAAPDWLSAIRRAFAEHPEVDLVGGKVLPRWNAPPPSWLTTNHYSPLALMDRGDQPFVTSISKPLCLVGANLSIRKRVFDEVASFDAEFQRVKDGIGSTEDHEFQLRFWRAGKLGLYWPHASVTADIQNERLTKAYHRRWHTGHGTFCARMRLIEVPPNAVMLFGMPGYYYKAVLAIVGRWLACALRRKESDAFFQELELRYAANYIKTAYRLSDDSGKRSPLGELYRFARSMIRRKYQSTVAAGKPLP